MFEKSEVRRVTRCSVGDGVKIGTARWSQESREKCDALWPLGHREAREAPEPVIATRLRLRKEDLELKLSDVQNSAAEQITFFQERNMLSEQQLKCI